VIALLVLALALQLPTPAAPPETRTYRFTIEPRLHALALELPSEWKVTDSTVEGNLTIRATPDKGRDFQLMLTPLVRDAGSPLSDPVELKLAVERRGHDLLHTAVETELNMLELKSRLGAIGYFYKLTDKREKLPTGEWRYICEGLVSLGPLTMSVTIFQLNPDKDQLWRILGWLQKAQYISLAQQP
jgi:hypothetical protein